MVLLEQVEACLDDNVIIAAEDQGDLVSDPFLHQVNVDLLDVDFLVELGGELGRPKALLIDAERHLRKSDGRAGRGGELRVVRVKVKRVKVRGSCQLFWSLGLDASASALRRQFIRGNYVRPDCSRDLHHHTNAKTPFHCTFTLE